MRWTDVDASDRSAVVVLLRTTASSRENEIARFKKHPKARELREWNKKRADSVVALRVAALELERMESRR